MVATKVHDQRDIRAENAQLRDQLARLRAENERLRAENERLSSENRHMHTALGAHVKCAQSTSLFGPLELTAGTCVGPRHRVTPRGRSAG